ncbi:DUF2249 domain-containing protein [Shinella daejeonensis]|uniref:DUF2249 domain-containing protein n=1 Tax=Shinella daejeonensis TaxID=659017 RepID=UPI0020C752E0|nr:DUF2249 domain-containing protein [Shinella daejeonensis]MCP8894424.1 DUF2249 domain-containing protein [Shinella daejeonensis]
MPDVSTQTPPRELDVRPILKSGGEPFQAIMAAVQALEPGQGLRLLATFHPVPLLQFLANRGFDHVSREIGDGDWEVLFTPQGAESPVEISYDADSPEAWPDPGLHLDLTDLDPPEPMVRILAAAERLGPGEVLFALLSREPLFLFPELVARGLQWVGNFDEAGATYRILVRAGRAKG